MFITIQQLIKKSSNELTKAKIDSAQLDAEILLCFILQKDRQYLLTHYDKKLIKSQALRYEKLTNRRAKNEPIAYILGEKWFYGLKFYVNKHVLVPRPETEMFISEIKDMSPADSSIIDIGTGSGCIIITLAKILTARNNNFFGIDISKKALTVARKNSKLHKTDIKFLHGDLLEPILKRKDLKQNIIITANLPYLTPEQVKNSPSIQKEPKLALVAGKDGLKYYRKLFKQIKKHNISSQIFAEIDPSQTSNIKKLAQKELGECKVEVKKDLARKDRLFHVKLFTQHRTHNNAH